MESYFGLIEAILVFGLVVGFGTQQLLSLRRLNREAAEKDKRDAP